MTIYDELVNAGLPVISAGEDGRISMGDMTPEQQVEYHEIILRYFDLPGYNLLLEARADIKALKDDYQLALTTLQSHIDEAAWTNTKIINAVVFHARVLMHILKVLRRMIA